MQPTVSESDLPLLQALSRVHPSAASAAAEAAGLRAGLALPAATVHLISDVHGEHGKLRHVLASAAGALRPVVASLLSSSLTEAEQRGLLNVVYYPGETLSSVRSPLIESGERKQWIRRTLQLLFELVRQLSRNWRREAFNRLLPAEFAELFKELLAEPLGLRPPGYFELMIGAYELLDRDFAAVRAAARLVRNLSTSEIIVAGDLGDRGPRIDKVIDILRRQPNVTLLWGNHDAHWMGACLGHEACIASVLRFSLRYQRLEQLEEGYGISLEPLERLARTAYADDDAAAFAVKGAGARDATLLARMQKAIAIVQLKLEGQITRRRPHFGLSERDVLSHVNLTAGTVTLGGHDYPLTDARLPTFSPRDPNALSAAELECMAELRSAFVESPRLWDHMSWLARNGAMWTRRDQLLIFHACVPVGTDGSPLELEVDGHRHSGRDLMDALARVVRRAYAKGADNLPPDSPELDWLWYLWCGPLSPLFGKDKIATFESYFVADKHAKEEKKNPYFELLHDPGFVRRIGGLFGCGDDVLIVNGHVPVKIEKGEQPLKRGGNAVTIDGAFSEAYGDKGYSMLLSASGVQLAEHSHFESVDAVIRQGRDLAPKVMVLRTFTPARKLADTANGEQARRQIHALEKLVRAYHDGVLQECL
jgi:fructose-1,6-bisphosphatase III